MISPNQFRTPVGWPVTYDDGTERERVCVLELDEHSFRVWLVWSLYERGAIAASANDGAVPYGDPVALRAARGVLAPCFDCGRRGGCDCGRFELGC